MKTVQVHLIIGTTLVPDLEAPITILNYAINFHILFKTVRSASSKEDSLCRWKPVQKNTKFRKGLGAGTFHHLGYTPNMETCVDLCCSMPVCGVAFKTKDRCYGVECISDDSCETVLAGKEDVKVEISHVRAGKRPGSNLFSLFAVKHSHVIIAITN